VALRPGVRITDLALLGDTLVVATSGEGLLLYHAGRVVGRIGRAEGLSSVSVNRVCAAEGELFVATAQGLDHISGLGAPGQTMRLGSMALGALAASVRDVAVNADHVLAANANREGQACPCRTCARCM
jgi:hypothetical protein